MHLPTDYSSLLLVPVGGVESGCRLRLWLMWNQGSQRCDRPTRPCQSSPMTSPAAEEVRFATPEPLRQPGQTALVWATVRLQSIFRGWRERRRLASVIQNVIRIQRVWRALKLKRQLRMEREREMQAVSFGRETNW